MSQENVNFSPFIGTVVVLFFMYSTMWTLMFLYYTDSFQDPVVTALGDPDRTFNIKSGGIFGVVINLLDGIGEVVSWFSPLILIKTFLAIVLVKTPFLYTLINLLILRPASWSVSIFTLNFVISKIPTVSGESG